MPVFALYLPFIFFFFLYFLFIQIIIPLNNDAFIGVLNALYTYPHNGFDRTILICYSSRVD